MALTSIGPTRGCTRFPISGSFGTTFIFEKLEIAGGRLSGLNPNRFRSNPILGCWWHSLRFRRPGSAHVFRFPGHFDRRSFCQVWENAPGTTFGWFGKVSPFEFRPRVGSPMLVASGLSEVEAEPKPVFRTESGILTFSCPKISPSPTRKSMSGSYGTTLFRR